MVEKIENAQIKDVYLGFQDIPPGTNFIFAINYETASGLGGIMHFNPLVIPIVLKQLGKNCIENLKGHYIQVKYIDNKVPYAIKSILAKKEEEWIKTDDRFFGDDFLIEIGDIK